MDDSSLFLQWAVSTLQHHDPSVLPDNADEDAAFLSLQELREASQAATAVQQPTEFAEATESSGDTGSGGAIGCAWSMSPTSGETSLPRSTGSVLPMGWNFGGAISARPSSGGTLNVTPAVVATTPERVYGSQPTRRASARSTAGAYAQTHIMAERKRRETINQRFIELSAVIPGLKKMDKATILAEAVRHVKELQERVKFLEAAAGNSNGKSIEEVVLVKKAGMVTPGDYGSSTARSGTLARRPLPEIEAKISENNVMVRIHCENGKGLVVRVLAKAEALHLRIVNSNVMPFTASTVIITIMAKMQEGLAVKAEEMVGSLNSALHHSTSSSNSDN